MPSKFGVFCVSCGFLFIAGFALGQKEGDRRQSQLPVSVTAMDLNLIQANLYLLRGAVGYDKDGIGAPEVYFNTSTGRVKALAFVDADTPEKKPFDVVRAELMFSVAQTRASAATFVPELKGFPKVDIEMDFVGTASKRMISDAISGSTPKGLEEYKFQAQYRNGELNIRQESSPTE